MSDDQGWGDRAADQRPPGGPPAPAGFPTYPTYPAGSNYPAGPATQWGDPSQGEPVQPSTIRTAVRLMWAGAALSLLSLVVSLVALDSMESRVRSRLTASDTRLTPAEVDSLLTVIVAIAVITSLIAILLWLWMAWKNGQGRSWARIVATLLGGLNLVSSLAAVTSGQSGGVGLLLTLVNLVLAVVILALLWSKPSSAFYDAVKRHRLG